METRPVACVVSKIGKFLLMAIFFNISGHSYPFAIMIQGVSSLASLEKQANCDSLLISFTKEISFSPNNIILLKSVCLKNPANSKPGRFISGTKTSLSNAVSSPDT